MKINDRVKLSELGLAVRKNRDAWSKRFGTIASQPEYRSLCVAVKWDGNKYQEYVHRSFLQVLPRGCKCCGAVSDIFMVNDDLWLTVATKDELMCLECFEKAIGRTISLADLRPCLWTATLLKLVDRVKRGQL